MTRKVSGEKEERKFEQMKNLLLTLALIALGYIAYQHYYKRQPQEIETPTKQEVKEPEISVPVLLEKKEIKQPPKKKVEQPQKEKTKITEPKIEIAEPKPVKSTLSQSTKTAIARIRRCIANGRYFEAVTLCETVRIPKGMNTERKFFTSLVSKVDKGLEKTMLSKISYLKNKKRKAKANYRQQSNKIERWKSPRKAIGKYAKDRQYQIDKKYEKKKIVMKKRLTLKYNMNMQKIDAEIRKAKSSIEQVRNTLRNI